MTSAPRAAWLALFGLTLVWGTAFLLVSKAVETLPPVIVAFGRIGFAAAAVIPFALLTGRRFPKDRGRWIAAFWTGTLSLALPFTLLSTAQQSVPSGVAGVYMAVIPLLIMPLAHFFASEPMTTRRVIGVSVGFVGVLCLIGPESLRQLGGETMRGQALCIAASLSYAVGSIMIRRAPKTDSLIAAASALLIGVAVLSPFALIHWPQTAPSRETALTVLSLGVAATGINRRAGLYVHERLYHARRRASGGRDLCERDRRGAGPDRIGADFGRLALGAARRADPPHHHAARLTRPLPTPAYCWAALDHTSG